MRGLMGSGCRMFTLLLDMCSQLSMGMEGFANIHGLHSKIFPPTPEELPSTEQSTESIAAKDQTSSEPSGGASTLAPTSKKAQEDIDKDWEAVEKPGETISEKATDISDEGEKVEAPDLGADDGEKVEKPVVKEPVDELAESGEVLPKSGLLKDW